MPYIKQEQRTRLNAKIDNLALEIFDLLPAREGGKVGKELDPSAKGLLNYAITRLLIRMDGDITSYSKINDFIGVLECCKLELYRRMAAPYENEKIKENGDVYPNYSE